MIVNPNDLDSAAHALRTYEGLVEKYLHEVESLKKGFREHYLPGYYELEDYWVLVDVDGTVRIDSKELG